MKFTFDIFTNDQNIKSNQNKCTKLLYKYILSLKVCKEKQNLKPTVFVVKKHFSYRIRKKKTKLVQLGIAEQLQA